MNENEPQDISQIIGLIIALAAIIYTFFSAYLDIFRKRKKPPQGDVEAIEEYLAEIEKQDEEQEIDEEEKPREIEPQSMPAAKWQKPEIKYAFKPTLDAFRPETSVEKQALHIGLRRPEELGSKALEELSQTKVERVQKHSRAAELITKLPSKKALIIVLEVMKRKY